MKSLMLACEFVSCVNLDVAFRTKSSFVGATDHSRRNFLTDITLYLHLLTRTVSVSLLNLSLKKKKKKKDCTFLVWFSGKSENSLAEMQVKKMVL